jgi:hypothetical protein
MRQSKPSPVTIPSIAAEQNRILLFDSKAGTKSFGKDGCQSQEWAVGQSGQASEIAHLN